MAKTETAVSNLKINRGTLANIEANLSSIGENELIITTDKNIPVPAVADSGKVVKVNASGEYELGNVDFPTITIALSQVVSQDPVQIQLTDAQYNVLANNLQVIIDLSDFNFPSVIWHRVIEETDLLIYSFAGDGTNMGQYYRFAILKSTKEASFESGDFDTNSYADGVTLVGDGEQYIYGELSLTGQLPYLTTAPSSNNTSGYIKIVVLSSEPSNKYAGYLYIITGSNS